MELPDPPGRATTNTAAPPAGVALDLAHYMAGGWGREGLPGVPRDNLRVAYYGSKVGEDEPLDLQL